jgi:hypothetical protein
MLHWGQTQGSLFWPLNLDLNFPSGTQDSLTLLLQQVGLHNRAHENHHHCHYLTPLPLSHNRWVLIWKLGKWVVVVVARQRGRRDIRCPCAWEWIMKPIQNVVHICPHAHKLWLSCIYRMTLQCHEWTNEARKIRLIHLTGTRRRFQEWHKQTDWQLVKRQQLPEKSTIDQCWTVITNRNTPCTDIRVALGIRNHHGSQFLNEKFK